MLAGGDWDIGQLKVFDDRFVNRRRWEDEYVQVYLAVHSQMPVSYSHTSSLPITILEILLALFAIWTLLQSRTLADNAENSLSDFLKRVCFSALTRPVAYAKAYAVLTILSMNGPQNVFFF